MPSKLQTYMQMADEAQRQITGSYRGWTGFLTTAARLYKYPYAEQVMIHAQRPDATACAEYDFWNEKMGRYVRRGSKGIALIDSSGERPRLRYVFDVSDTGGREFPKSRYLTSAKVVSWQEAAERIGQLLEQGEYAANVELAEAPGHERAELAQAVWYLRQDLSEKARAQGYLSCLSDMRGGGFPEETARLAERLTDPAFREVLMDDLAQLRSDYREDRSLLRFHYHKPDKIEQGLRELSLPRREYRTEMAEIPAVQRFITEDEIAATLTRGSNIAGGKGRIYAYFKEKHSPREQADFLKDEYGIGGRSHAVSGASHSGEDHSGKGVSLKKQDCPEIQLNWANVAKRISELIRKDRLLTPEEKTQYEQFQRQTAARSAAWNDYDAVKEAHPDNLVLFQVGDFFEMYGEDAKQAAELLNMNLTTRNIPGAGRVEMCGVPSHNLEMYVEKLRDKHDVTIAEAPNFRGERHIYTLRSVDHEAEAAIDAQEAEFGADGTRVFRDPAAEQAQPTGQELFERYRLSVGNALSKDEAFLNACRNSDRQNAYLEGAAAIRRIVTESGDLQLTRLYFDMPAFHNRLHQELLDELYPTLATTVTPSPYKVTQADIDAALQQWNGRIESKHAVVRYMKAHARDRDTAAWLAREYGLKDTSKPLQISVGNSEPVTLSWAKVQRRIAQLIQSDNFYTEQEQDNFDNIDPIAIREALAERGIVNGQVVDAEANRNSPFIRQVMADVERIAAQERKAQQGNRNKEVHIYRYVTESTFDAYLWQTVENKQKFISQIMTSKSPVRSCEDVDETALSYAEIKALCAGDERIKEKMDLDVDVARLKLMKASHRSQQFRLEDNLLRHFPEQIRQNESFVEGFTADMQTLSAHPHPVDGFAGMEVKGDLLTDKDNAGAAILEAFKDAKGMEPVPIGSYRGFAMSLTVEDFGRDFVLTLKGKMNHRVTLGKDARGNLTRIDNALNAMPDRLQNVRNTLDALTAQMETAKAELGKPFPQEDELRTKSARLAELNAELNIDDRTPMEQMAEDAPAVQSAKAERPSVLAKLKAPLSQPCAEDKIKHRNKEER